MKLFINFNQKKAKWDQPGKGYEEVLTVNYIVDSQDGNKKWTYCEDLMLKRYLKIGFININKTLIKRSYLGILNRADKLGLMPKHKEFDFVIQHYQKLIINHIIKKTFNLQLTLIQNVDIINKKVFDLYGQSFRNQITDECIRLSAEQTKAYKERYEVNKEYFKEEFEEIAVIKIYV